MTFAFAPASPKLVGERKGEQVVARGVLRPWSIQKPARKPLRRFEASSTPSVLTPDQGELQIELKGNLAAMLGAAQNAKRSPETGDLSLQVVMVAGGGFEPPTFGL